MRKIIFYLILATMLMACSEKEIEITSEYIINPNWTKKSEEAGANTIEIKKMKVKKDSVINPFTHLSQSEILDKLDYDSSFSYFANVKIKPEESYQNKKIYFKKENNFYWLKDSYGNSKAKIMGKLEAKNWYEISGLNYYYYVVYIDSLDLVHRYVINLKNY